MAEQSPVVYLLHGEEEFGIAETIAKLSEHIGDPSMADLNTTRIAAGQLDIEELRASANATPFLASHRLVIVEDATRRLTTKEDQEKFCALLDNLPETTKLVLVQRKALKDSHWLLKWAKGADGRAYVKSFAAAKGGQMANWIRAQAKHQGGEITNQAAYLLAEMIGQDSRLADGEITKLLTYVNFQRPVDVDDVENLSAFVGKQGDFFGLIDAMGAQNGRQAMDMLHSLLRDQDGMLLFFGLVGHFRLLIQAREILENGGRENDVAKELGIHPFRAKKLFGQARTLKMDTLETIYRRLLEYDQGMKTGKLSAELALDELVTKLTAAK
jgi:DNA polymerase-3 subunit delta